MRRCGTLPAGVRLDDWPAAPVLEALEDTPEITSLREELRKSMPYLARQLEILDKVRQFRDLAGRVVAPPPAKLTTRKS